jgi:hypothetical protein
MKQSVESNLLTLRPKWNRNWEKTENGLAVIMVPKFGNHSLGKWLMQRMSNPNYRLKLDELGSFVWEHCDGTENVQQIADKLKKKYGDKVEPVYDRLGIFLNRLERSKSIIWV